MTMPSTTTVAPVRKSVTVRTDAANAFATFTAGIDTWWPRGHHIGKGTLERTVLEPKPGGRCYGRTTDGVETDWGRVLVWEPPQRFVLAWQITPEWKCQPDLAQSSEVEVIFTPLDSRTTRVDLEHRHLERHGAGGEAMRAGVDAPNGWSGILTQFSEKASGDSAEPKPAKPIPASPVAYIFRLNSGLMTRAIDGLSDEQAWTRPSAQTNAMLWIIAHAVTVRASTLKLLGKTVDTGWGDIFGRGKTPSASDAYPPREEILRVHAAVAEALENAFAALTEADLARPATLPKLPAAQTLSDQLAFLALHDSYHVGQLGYIRKELGFNGMVG